MLSLMGRFLSVLTLLIAGGVSARASAQESTVAQVLYTDAQRLVLAGDTHKACLKFGESQRIDPRLNTLIALAACHEREGKTATAWGEFLEAKEQAAARGDATRAEFAETRAAALAMRTHRILFALPSPPPGVELSLAGKTFGAAAFGSSIPLDPGEYEVVVSAPGRPRWTTDLYVDSAPGEERVDVVLAASAPAMPMITTRPREPSTSSRDRLTHGGTSVRRLVGIVAGATGVAALIVGAGAGTVAIEKRSDLASACGPGGIARCSAANAGAVEQDRSAAVSAGTVADVGIIGGAVLVGLGAILYFLPPPARAATQVTILPRWGRGESGAVLEATW